MPILIVIKNNVDNPIAKINVSVKFFILFCFYIGYTYYTNIVEKGYNCIGILSTKLIIVFILILFFVVDEISFLTLAIRLKNISL